MFGGLSVILLSIALLAAAMWADVIPSPFTAEIHDPDAESEQPAQVIPCPPVDALPVPEDELQFNILNGTTREGLASQANASLSERGMIAASIGNAPAYDAEVRLVTSAEGLPHAYTIATQFANPVINLDTRTDISVDVILGDQYEQLLPADEAAIDPAVALVGIEGCTPVESSGD